MIIEDAQRVMAEFLGIECGLVLDDEERTFLSKAASSSLRVQIQKIQGLQSEKDLLLKKAPEDDSNIADVKSRFEKLRGLKGDISSCKFALCQFIEVLSLYGFDLEEMSTAKSLVDEV